MPVVPQVDNFWLNSLARVIPLFGLALHLNKPLYISTPGEDKEMVDAPVPVPSKGKSREHPVVVPTLLQEPEVASLSQPVTLKLGELLGTSYDLRH